MSYSDHPNQPPEENRFEPEPYQCEPAAAGQIAPRDEEPLRSTDDLLFLAKLLEDCRQTGWLDAWRDPEIGHCYQAVAKSESPASKGHQHMKLSALRKIVREHQYWSLRRLCREPDGHRIELPGKLALKHPVKEATDPLLEGELDTAFRSWSSANPPPVVPPGQVLCPVCGPMPVVKINVSSPEETWEMLCGREYDFFCCSGCLGVLDSLLVRMN